MFYLNGRLCSSGFYLGIRDLCGILWINLSRILLKVMASFSSIFFLRAYFYWYCWIIFVCPRWIYACEKLSSDIIAQDMFNKKTFSVYLRAVILNWIEEIWWLVFALVDFWNECWNRLEKVTRVFFTLCKSRAPHGGAKDDRFSML